MGTAECLGNFNFVLPFAVSNRRRNSIMEDEGQSETFSLLVLQVKNVSMSCILVCLPEKNGASAKSVPSGLRKGCGQL